MNITWEQNYTSVFNGDTCVRIVCTKNDFIFRFRLILKYFSLDIYFQVGSAPQFSFSPLMTRNLYLKDGF